MSNLVRPIKIVHVITGLAAGGAEPPSGMKALRVRARERVSEHFTLQSTLAQYAELYENVARV